MKAKKRIRILRVLAIAGSLSALAVPTAALGKPVDGPYIPVRAENGVQAPHHLVVQAQHWTTTFPPNVQSEGQSGAQPFSLPPGFHSEVQTSTRPVAQQPFNLPAGYKPEVQKTPVSSPTPVSSVVREIRTVTDDGGRTLAIALAAIALAIALSTTAYAALRIQRMQRRLLGSSSRPLVS